MSSIGEYLKSSRAEKKITLEEVEKNTKIKLRILQQIENNEFTDLGGMGYAKAMVFSIGRFIGADEKRLELLFNKQFNEQKKHSSIFSSDHPKKILLPANILSILLLIFVVIVLTWLSYYLYQKDLLKLPIPVKKKPETENVIKIQPKELKPKQKKDVTSNENGEIQNDISVKALSDTTDYLNTYLFKKNKSPFNTSE
jgi:cytoskeletal protein RodZ